MGKVTWVQSEASNQIRRYLLCGTMARVPTTGALNSMTYESWRVVPVASSTIIFGVTRAFSSRYVAPDGFVPTA